MIVGARDFDWSREDIERSLRGVSPEPIREHMVELVGTAYPPKQVVARVTGWSRTTFTTMEAVRVLSKLGFSCRRGRSLPDGKEAWVLEPGEADEVKSYGDRVHALESALVTAQAATAGLARRIEILEQRPA